jgi:hypothetical protein
MQARNELATKKFRLETETRKRLEDGKLADGHLHARAKRKAVKILLSHYWVKAREARGLSVTVPYAEGILRHSDIIRPAA